MAGADAASVVPAERLLLDLQPRVVGEDPAVVEGCDEVIPRRAGVPPGGVVIYVCVVVILEVHQPNGPSGPS